MNIDEVDKMIEDVCNMGTGYLKLTHIPMVDDMNHELELRTDGNYQCINCKKLINYWVTVPECKGKPEIFCGQCKYYSPAGALWGLTYSDGCTHEKHSTKTNTHVKVNIKHGDPSVFNKNNNCPNYEEK